MIRPKISGSNLNYFLAQQYGYASMKQFFKLTENHREHKEKVIKQIIKEFTGYAFKKGKLQTYNPYTGKYEALEIKNFKHVQTRVELMKELMMLHKTRQQMLIQSRKRILVLSKKITHQRDRDLQQKASEQSKRLHQLQRNQEQELQKDQELEP